MRRCSRWVGVVLATVATFLTMQVRSGASHAEEPASVSVPTQPWASFWISSLGRTMAACDLIFESVDRPDLSESMESRLGDYRAFAGIDRKRPLGLMWTWHGIEPAAFVFLPVGEIDELLKTATFDVVGYHKVADDRYEIERPEIPYHVLLRSGYALFGEDVAAMKALRLTPDQLTQPLREKYDIVLHIDLRQVPRESKAIWIDELRKQVEPWLQPQDSEPSETAALRKTIGAALLGVVERLVFDVQAITLGGRIEAESRQLSLELTIQSESGSELSAVLNRLVSKRSEFSALMNRHATASLAVNWPIPVFGKTLMSSEQAKGAVARINAGIQVVGRGWGESALIAGLHGPEAAAVNAAIPRMILNLEKSGQFSAVSENADIHRGVVLHSMVPRDIPDQLKQLVGPEVEFFIGQGKQTVWFAAGNPETLPMQLQQAIDAVEDAPESEKTAELLSAKLTVQKPTAAPSDAAPADNNPPASQDADEFRLSVEPLRDGLKFRLVAEQGILRLIGRDWIRQIEEQNAAQ